ncbi:SDR family NAD(P)-dependent oxidoreductase [Streptomyces sp. B3I8]|uniref:SDR family NAD(P)-dependent oxidoreductase n=1 Tax=Streptomyces sp. B3I8 TaxID=3042303 RepID=UPI00277E813F|nr:SDR family NAD(P)-dependent oxidoreductase [Streptomyces sp. B3I8]MDQ0787785.1 hypothetical protein [Streptomyces sp. B3I8]
MPSKTTFYRLVEAVSVGTHAFGSAVSRRSQARRPEGMFTPSAACRPGELVQIDTAPLDVLVILENGVSGRPELTIAVDVATRTICAAVLRPAGTKAVDASLLLAKTLVPEPLRPGRPEALRPPPVLLGHHGASDHPDFHNHMRWDAKDSRCPAPTDGTLVRGLALRHFYWERTPVVRAVQARGVTAIAVHGDVSVPADVERLFARTVEAYGRFDILILVNNAGVHIRDRTQPAPDAVAVSRPGSAPACWRRPPRAR